MPSIERSSRLLDPRGLLVGAFLLLGASACNKDGAPAAADAKAPSTGVTTAPAPAPDQEPVASTPAGAAGTPAPGGVSAESQAAGDGFELSFSAPGAHQQKEKALASIVLLAKPPFKVNDKYPYKMKLNETPGVQFENLVVGADAVELEKMRATMKVPFTPQASGKHRLSGRFSFSVCTEEKCLIEKRDLAVDVDVD